MPTSRELIFLSCSKVTSHVGDDLLVTPHLPDFQIREVDWKKFEPKPEVQAAAVIRTTWDYHLSLNDFLGKLRQIEASGVKLMNPASLVEWNSNKIYLKELEAQGVKIPKSYFMTWESIDQVRELILGGGDWIVKPQVSLSAHNTFWIHAAEQEKELAHAFTALKGDNIILQAFCEEVLDPGEISLVFFKGEFSHAALKTPKSGDFRVQDEHGGHIRRYQPSAEEIQTAKNTLSKVKHDWLYARVDMIPSRKNGLLLMELEMIEPSLYFRTSEEGPKNLARAIKDWLK